MRWVRTTQWVGSRTHSRLDGATASGKENMLCTHNEIWSSYEKDILPVVAAWMHLEAVLLSETGQA